MPLDSIMWDNDLFKRRCIGWQLKYSLIPRKCYYTGKSIWFKLAYQGTAMITGPGEPVFETRWCDREQYLFLKIKGII
jgi:hypothetical protein